MLSNKNIWTKTKTLEIYCSSSTLNFRFNLVFISYPLQKFNPNFWVPPKIAEMTPWKWIFTSPSSCYPFLPPKHYFAPDIEFDIVMQFLVILAKISPPPTHTPTSWNSAYQFLYLFQALKGLSRAGKIRCSLCFTIHL